MASDNFDASRDFYRDIFEMAVSVDESWYLQMAAPDRRSVNIGFLQPGHELFSGRGPGRGAPGMVVSIQVDDVDEAYARARARQAEIPLEIRDADFGQRHFLVVDPNGLVLNVMSPI